MSYPQVLAERYQLRGTLGHGGMAEVREAWDTQLQRPVAVKLLYPQRASALSIGSDVVLSSVGHGSAMDIAGQGIANPEAMMRTVRLLAGIPLESHV